MADKMMTAQGVANRLFSAEAAVDGALGEASRLMGELMSARQELRIAAQTGDAAVSKVAEAVATLAAARHALVEAHGELTDAKLRIGIRTRMIGEHPKHETSASADVRSIAS
jgi:hypothetical protein